MRAYYHGYRREGLAGVHIVRESELKTYRRSLYPPGDRAWCGQSVTNHTRSPVVDVNPMQPLGEGLHWHWPCVFAHALHLGLSDRILALVLETEAEGERIRVAELAAKEMPSHDDEPGTVDLMAALRASFERAKAARAAGHDVTPGHDQ